MHEVHLPPDQAEVQSRDPGRTVQHVGGQRVGDQVGGVISGIVGVRPVHIIRHVPIREPTAQGTCVGIYAIVHPGAEIPFQPLSNGY